MIIVRRLTTEVECILWFNKIESDVIFNFADNIANNISYWITY